VPILLWKVKRYASLRTLAVDVFPVIKGPFSLEALDWRHRAMKKGQGLTPLPV
jgi:hypothetical protein